MGLNSANPPGGSCELPVVNCSSLANCSLEKPSSAAQNHLSVLPKKMSLLTTVWYFFNSEILYSRTPQRSNSSSKMERYSHAIVMSRL